MEEEKLEEEINSKSFGAGLRKISSTGSSTRHRKFQWPLTRSSDTLVRCYFQCTVDSMEKNSVPREVPMAYTPSIGLSTIVSHREHVFQCSKLPSAPEAPMPIRLSTRASLREHVFGISKTLQHRKFRRPIGVMYQSNDASPLLCQTCNDYYLHTMIGSSDALHRKFWCLLTFCSELVTAKGASLPYIRWPPRSFDMPLQHWTPKATLVLRRETLSLKFNQIQKNSTKWRVASVLELRASLVTVKWKLRSLLLLVFDGT